jgi:hypothetical protein
MIQQAEQYRKIAIPLNSGGFFVLGSFSENFDRDSDEDGGIRLAGGWKVWLNDSGEIKFNGRNIRLLETKNYCWAIDKPESDVAKVESSLNDNRWKV